MPGSESIEKAYALARENYAELGVDTDTAMETLAGLALSLHCWQGDDVKGFENPEAGLDGGLAATGDYLGAARNADELRSDLDKAYHLIPGTHRVNLHSFYAEPGDTKVPRNELQPEHFSAWLDWAKAGGHGIDFNPSCFSHPNSASGLTLASYDDGIRQFWIEHCIACRKIGAHMGKELGSPTVTNIWIPDGLKDSPADRKTPRMLLKASLDKILAEPIDPQHNLDSIECKLFGIGSESYVVGSHEFYLGYAVANPDVLLCLDSGHFHPTEVISDKLSAVLLYIDELLLHVSRGVRWDSDHVVILSDELRAIAQELVRGNFLERVHMGLDYFDASINRVAAWIIGTRSMLQALLLALLEPTDRLRAAEIEGDFTTRLAMLEDLKARPFGAVWDHYCLTQDVPPRGAWLDDVKAYERTVLAGRSKR